MSVHGLTGMLKNVLYVSILFATPFENSNTCFSIYRRKAFECQRPIIMIVYTGVLAKYIIMAPPARTEWVPTSLAVNPRMFLPMIETTRLMSVMISLLRISACLPDAS